MDLALAGRLLAACAVIALVLAAVRLGGRGLARAADAPRAGGRLVRVLETTPLPDAAALHVVRVADRHYLIGRSRGGLATLCEIPSDAIASRSAPSAGTGLSRFGRAAAPGGVPAAAATEAAAG